ncbi:MAG: L,D-transpeptidase [Alphaproteobacteria bacterium]
MRQGAFNQSLARAIYRVGFMFLKVSLLTMFRVLLPAVAGALLALTTSLSAETNTFPLLAPLDWLLGTQSASHARAPAAQQQSVFARTGTTQRPVYASGGRGGINPAYLPKLVRIETKYPKGTIIVDTRIRYLFLVLGDGTAMRYGVGVGRRGFEWKGTQRISRKAEWPSWTPPAAMRKRQPGLPVHMAGGPDNPLGARALYLGSTLYRIHGSNQPWTIGQAVSSGCIRMRNEDVVELYRRVRVGAKVVVL